MKSNEIIPVGPALFFDDNGCGPDHVELTVSAMPSLPEIPSSGGLALNVGVPEGEIGMLVKEGGFFMKHETIAELHRKLGEYLGHASEHNAAFADEQASKKIRALDTRDAEIAEIDDDGDTFEMPRCAVCMWPRDQCECAKLASSQPFPRKDPT